MDAALDPAAGQTLAGFVQSAWHRVLSESASPFAPPAAQYPFATALLFVIFLAMLLIFDFFIGVVSWCLSSWNHLKVVLVDRLKEELLALGVVSILVSFITATLAHMCIKSKAPEDYDYSGDTAEAQDASEQDSSCPAGEAPLFPETVVHSSHYLLFWIAITQILYTLWSATFTAWRFSRLQLWDQKVRKDEKSVHKRVKKPKRIATITELNKLKPPSCSSKSGSGSLRSKTESGTAVSPDDDASRIELAAGNMAATADSLSSEQNNTPSNALDSVRQKDVETSNADTTSPPVEQISRFKYMLHFVCVVLTGGLETNVYRALRKMLLLRVYSDPHARGLYNMNLAVASEQLVQAEINQVHAHTWVQILLIAFLVVYQNRVYQVIWINLPVFIVLMATSAKLQSITRRAMHLIDAKLPDELLLRGAKDVLRPAQPFSTAPSQEPLLSSNGDAHVTLQIQESKIPRPAAVVQSTTAPGASKASPKSPYASLTISVDDMAASMTVRGVAVHTPGALATMSAAPLNSTRPLPSRGSARNAPGAVTPFGMPARTLSSGARVRSVQRSESLGAASTQQQVVVVTERHTLARSSFGVNEETLAHIHIVEEQIRDMFWFGKPVLMIWIVELLIVCNACVVTICFYLLSRFAGTSSFPVVKPWVIAIILVYNFFVSIYIGWVVVPQYAILTTGVATKIHKMLHHLEWATVINEEQENGVAGLTVKGLDMLHHRMRLCLGDRDSRHGAHHKHEHDGHDPQRHLLEVEGAELASAWVASLALRAGTLLAAEANATAQLRLQQYCPLFLAIVTQWRNLLLVHQGKLSRPEQGFCVQGGSFLSVFRLAFDELEADGDGWIVRHEMKMHLREYFHAHISDTQARAMMGEVCGPDLLAAWQDQFNQGVGILPPDDRARESVCFHTFVMFAVFAWLDPRKKGLLEVGCMREVLTQSGCDISEEDLNAMLQLVMTSTDTNRVGPTQFLALMFNINLA